jgi:hypothetical protein
MTPRLAQTRSQQVSEVSLRASTGARRVNEDVELLADVEWHAVLLDAVNHLENAGVDAFSAVAR